MIAIKILFAIVMVVSLMAIPADAYEFESRSLERLVLDSSTVAQVKILSSKMYIVKRNHGTVDCGNVYTAKVVRSYKGDAHRVRFVTTARLPIRVRYMVFLTDEFRDGAIKFTSMGANQEEEYRACIAGEVKLYASMMHGEVYQIEYSENSGDRPAAIKAATAIEPFDGTIRADKIEIGSPKLSVEESDTLSYWRVPWSVFEPRLLLAAEKRVRACD